MQGCFKIAKSVCKGCAEDVSSTAYLCVCVGCAPYLSVTAWPMIVSGPSSAVGGSK